MRAPEHMRPIQFVNEVNPNAFEWKYNVACVGVMGDRGDRHYICSQEDRDVSLQAAVNSMISLRVNSPGPHRQVIFAFDAGIKHTLVVFETDVNMDVKGWSVAGIAREIEAYRNQFYHVRDSATYDPGEIYVINEAEGRMDYIPMHSSRNRRPPYLYEGY